MKIKLDENLPVEMAADLRTAGYQAETVDDEKLSGAPDTTIMDRVRAEGRVLITMDKGIANIRTHPPALYAGIILLRLRATGRNYVRTFARQQLPKVLGSSPKGKLWVVSEAGIRKR